MSTNLSSIIEEFVKLNAADYASSAIGSETKVAYLGNDQSQPIMRISDFICNGVEAYTGIDNLSDVVCGLREYWVAPEHGMHLVDYLENVVGNTAVELSEDWVKNFFEKEFEKYLRGSIPDYEIRWADFYRKNKKQKKDEKKNDKLGRYYKYQYLIDLYQE